MKGKKGDTKNRKLNIINIEEAKDKSYFDLDEIEIIDHFFESLAYNPKYNREQLKSVKASMLSGTDVNDIKFATKVSGRRLDTSVLHHAVRNSDVKMIDLLLKHGAEIEAKDQYDRTPLHVAAVKGLTDIVQLLLEKGANIETKDLDDDKPMHIAAARELTDVVKLLVEKGANINVNDRFYITPLYLAAVKGFTDIVKLLLEKGANTEAKDYEGETPLYLAAKYGHTEVVILLLQHGANPEVSFDDVEDLEIINILSIAKAIKTLSTDPADTNALEVLKYITPSGKELVENIIKNKIDKINKGLSKITLEQSLGELANLQKALKECNENKEYEDKYNILILERELEDWYGAEGGNVLKLFYQAAKKLLDTQSALSCCPVEVNEKYYKFVNILVNSKLIGDISKQRFDDYANE